MRKMGVVNGCSDPTNREGITELDDLTAAPNNTNPIICNVRAMLSTVFCGNNGSFVSGISLVSHSAMIFGLAISHILKNPCINIYALMPRIISIAPVVPPEKRFKRPDAWDSLCSERPIETTKSMVCITCQRKYTPRIRMIMRKRSRYDIYVIVIVTKIDNCLTYLNILLEIYCLR